MLFYPIYQAIYNLYLNPLRTYPGPKLNAISRIPYIMQIIRGTPHVYLKALHDKYGDVVRITPDELSYNNDAWRDIFGHRTSGKESFPKDMVFLGPDLVGSGGIFRAQGDAAHARVRKIFSHAFSDRALKDQAQIFQGYVDQLVDNIRKILHQDEKVKLPISDMFNFLTFDIMGDLTFGEPLGLLTDGKYSTWVASVFGSIQLVAFSRILRWYPMLNQAIQFILPKNIKEKRRNTINYTMERVDKRLARGETDRPDVWTCIMKHKEEDRLTYPEMQSSASTFMIAGTETTATLLSGLTFLLLKNPDIYAKLVHEIRSTFTTTEDINISSLARLEYLNACLEETLRIYPPTPNGFPRIVPSSGAIVCGKHVPAGVSHSKSGEHDRSDLSGYRPLFPLPTLQRTTRRRTSIWLISSYLSAGWEIRDSSPTRRACSNRFPMGLATVLARSMYHSDHRTLICLHAMSVVLDEEANPPCVNSLAYHEMRLAMTKVLYNFDLVNLCDESQDWMDQKVWGVWQKPKLMVQLKERAS